jgi:starch phosphorylase
MGKFSSDRAIQDYAQEYWNIESIQPSRKVKENI